MTIALDTEVVATRHDPKTGDCFYTIERNGKRWTAKVHESDFAKVGVGPASIAQRRAILAKALEAAMRGPEDIDYSDYEIVGITVIKHDV